MRIWSVSIPDQLPSHNLLRCCLELIKLKFPPASPWELKTSGQRLVVSMVLFTAQRLTHRENKQGIWFSRSAALLLHHAMRFVRLAGSSSENTVHIPAGKIFFSHNKSAKNDQPALIQLSQTEPNISFQFLPILGAHVSYCYPITVT